MVDLHDMERIFGPKPAFQQMNQDNLQPASYLMTIASAQALDLLGEVFPIQLLGATLSQRASMGE
jgi:hypothetical protein